MSKTLFLNRDLSWLSFNHRVLMDAQDVSVPVLERLKFSAIYSNNLDEFFRVRVASARHVAEIGKKKINKEFQADPDELLTKIHKEVDRQLIEYGQTLEVILAELKEAGIHIYTNLNAIPSNKHSELLHYFKTNVLGHLKPYIFEEEEESPFLDNGNLYFALRLKKENREYFAYLDIPSYKMPRFYLLELDNGNYGYCFLDDIIQLHLDLVFQGYDVLECKSIKLNKDADLHIDDEFDGDLVEKIEKQIKKRNLGAPARFLYDGSISERLLNKFLDSFVIEPADLVEGGRYHNLNDYFQIKNPTDNDLEFPSQPPLKSSSIEEERSVLKAIEKSDQILHFPYQSYDYILQFFNDAAIDPDVKEVNVTFYRMAKDSMIGHALISAANNGKKVKVFMEVKARFDEENNLFWATKMKQAGIQLVYSMPGLKVHAKVALVKKKNKNGKEISYGFFGTGNLNENTAKIYCDHGLLTTDETLTSELGSMFEFLHTKQKPEDFSELIVSQFDAFDEFSKLIDREILHVKEGRKGKIILKMNNLEERGLIKKIYEAAEAGVEITLIIRSICCLKPGVQNLKVIRIVDRYLEHARVFYFYNDGKEDVRMGSSDWMKRNIFRRVEVTFPVKDKAIKAQIMYIVDLQIRDNRKARYFTSGYKNILVQNDDEKIRSQQATYGYIKSFNQSG